MREAKSVPLTDNFAHRRDEFGIKPFYYTVQNGNLYYAPEAKLLLPFLPNIETDLEAFKEYITFQYYLNGKTLFKGIKELPPAHELTLDNSKVKIKKYWELNFEPDFDHTQKYFQEKTLDLLEKSTKQYLKQWEGKKTACYLSGGIDSSSIAVLSKNKLAYHGKFLEQGYREDYYARLVAKQHGIDLRETELTPQLFKDNIRDVIRCLDYPTMGPGAFPQYMTAKRASKDGIQVLFGGQGGDELFGGYVKYLIAYWEQTFKGAIEGTLRNGNFVVTTESIIPNMEQLRQYIPLVKEFFAEGLFDSMDKRYFRMVNRANTIRDEIRWELLGSYNPWEAFSSLFNSPGVKKESYFDLMSRYDIRYGLPPMLQVEDRVSQAHGIESVMPFLGRELVEFSATIPSSIKFKDGRTKFLLREVVKGLLPMEVVERKDKMGFPTPIAEWCQGECKDFVHDIFSSQKALQRDLVNNRKVLEELEKGEIPKYSRKLWGLLSLELWQQEYHDKASEWKQAKG